jgi:hypothetical protein
VLHIPVLAYFTSFVLIFGNRLSGYRLLVYLLAPSFILLLCLFTGALLRRLLPQAYRVMTGGRGFR